MTSGGYKDQVIAKFMEYNSFDELKNKLKYILIFCGNSEYHLESMNHPDYGHYIYAVIDDQNAIIQTLAEMMKEMNEDK